MTSKDRSARTRRAHPCRGLHPLSMNRQAGRGRRERRDGATHLKGANVRSRTRIRPRGVEAIEVVEDEAPIHTWTRRVEVQRLVNEQWVRVDTLRFLASARPERRERAVGRRVVP